MKFYLAPLQSLTGFVYRNSYEKNFHNIDKYFTPFIVPNKGKNFKTKDFVDVLPENNEGVNIIPQILSNNSEGFIFTAKKLKSLGYGEINLNLGCPSRMSAAKSRGSGFLAFPEELDRFLNHIYEIDDIKISVKTRLGIDDGDEFYNLMKIFNKYPMEELIIHPRTRNDFYGNTPNLKVFGDALAISKNPICYNGDIFTKENYETFTKDFPSVKRMMIGRGIIANPGLIDEIKTGNTLSKEKLRRFHDDLLEKYIEECIEDYFVLIKFKEIWGYMSYIFEADSDYIKNIRRAQTIPQYKDAVSKLLTETDIIKGAGLFTRGNWGV